MVSYNEGLGCICPLLLWPIPKSYRVITPNYCSKTSGAHTLPKHIHHILREHASCSRPPWILPIRMTVKRTGLSRRWRWQRSQYHKEEVSDKKSDANSIKTDERNESEDEHWGTQGQSSHPNQYLGDVNSNKHHFAFFASNR